MVNVASSPHRDTGDDARELRRQVERLRAENGRLRSKNRDLRVAVDAYVRRANRPGLFGPLEMTAGTCVGPRCRRGGRVGLARGLSPDELGISHHSARATRGSDRSQAAVAAAP